MYKLIKQIALIYSLSTFLGWNMVITLLIYQSAKGLDDSTLILNLVRILTFTQIIEILFIKWKQLLSTYNIAKYLGFALRLIFQWTFMRPDICFCSLRNSLFFFNFGEILRAAYYLSDKNQSLNVLRYMIAPLTIPLSSVGMYRLVNRAIENNQDVKVEIFCATQLIVILVATFQVAQILIRIKSIYVIQFSEQKPITKSMQSSFVSNKSEVVKKEKSF